MNTTLKIVKMLVPSSKYSIKCPYTMKPEGVCIHNTYNDASAKAEISYMINNNNQTSFHYAVDNTQAVQGIEHTRNAWHAGDGRLGNGNRKYIAIEICYSKSGGSRFTEAQNNGALLAAKILKQYGWGVDRLKKHQDFSGKYCPHRTLQDYGWSNFKKLVQKYLDELNKPVFKEYKVKVLVSALNIRKTPNWKDSDVVGVIKDKGIYTIVGEKKLDGTTFGKLKSGAGYISLGSDYVKKV